MDGHEALRRMGELIFLEEKMECRKLIDWYVSRGPCTLGPTQTGFLVWGEETDIFHLFERQDKIYYRVIALGWHATQLVRDSDYQKARTLLDEVRTFLKEKESV